MTSKERTFVREVNGHYKRHGRQSLPWRHLPADRQGHVNPYKILVSEIMLQQTQVDRVIPKYKSFLKKFPTVKKLSSGTLGEVLKEWQGLGYNRRAKNLHTCAKFIQDELRGLTPKKYEELIKLPGVGPYTAGAVMAFAYNKPVVMIETNIRTAYLHHFFSNKTNVTDREIVRYIALTLDKKNPREWYWALMDYGAYIKKEFGNPNSRSKHYIKQSTFNGSDRQIRGAIIRLLSEGNATRKKLHSTFIFETDRIDAQLERLLEEGMVAKRQQKYLLPT